MVIWYILVQLNNRYAGDMQTIKLSLEEGTSNLPKGAGLT
jgi:hypothetical protein